MPPPTSGESVSTPNQKVKMPNILKSLPLVAAITLTACGGGGGDDSTSGNSTQFPFSTIAESIAKEARVYQLTISESVTEPGRTLKFNGSGTYTIVSTTTSFEGATAIQKTATSGGSGTIDGRSSVIGFGDTTSSFYGPDFKLVGYIDAGSYCVAASQADLPSSVSVGQTGPLYNLNCYTNSSKATKIGSASASYALESAPSENSAFFKVTLQTTGTQGQTRKTVTTYRVTSSAPIVLVSEVSAFVGNGSSAKTETTYK